MDFRIHVMFAPWRVHPPVSIHDFSDWEDDRRGSIGSSGSPAVGISASASTMGPHWYRNSKKVTGKNHTKRVISCNLVDHWSLIIINHSQSIEFNDTSNRSHLSFIVSYLLSFGCYDRSSFLSAGSENLREHLNFPISKGLFKWRVYSIFRHTWPLWYAWIHL